MGERTATLGGIWDVLTLTLGLGLFDSKLVLGGGGDGKKGLTNRRRFGFGELSSLESPALFEAFMLMKRLLYTVALTYFKKYQKLNPYKGIRIIT